jgi:hypothetical protein
MNKFNQLSKDIRNAVSLFAEFGQRNYYERKGRVIIMNDVYEPEAEGIFLARCARKIAKRMGTEYAHEWALQQFTEGVYNRLQARNKVNRSETSKRLEIRKRLTEYLDSLPDFAPVNG